MVPSGLGASSGDVATEVLCSELSWGLGFYAEAKTEGVKFKGEALGELAAGNWCADATEVKTGVHVKVDAKIFSITWHILDASYMHTVSATAPQSVSYTPGGTRAVHAGATPLLGDGSSTDIVDQGSIVFRTALGTKLSQITDREDTPTVAFEADNADAGTGRAEGDQVAWSVVVHGRAELITTSTDVFDSFDIHVHPWHASRKPFFVRLVPYRVTGRRFVVTRR